MYDVLRFWLARGVDGFRIDVIWHLAKDAEFRDNPANPAWTASAPESHALLPIYTTDRPEVMEIVAEMRAVVAEFDRPDASRILIGEIYLPIERLVTYYGPDDSGVLRGVQLPFNFHLIGAQWQAAALADLIRRYDAALPDRCLAELGPRQPRPVADRDPRRRGACATRGAAAADLARDADALLRRRTRLARYRYPARGAARSGGTARAGQGARS